MAKDVEKIKKERAGGGEELTRRKSTCRCGCGLRGGEGNMEVETLSA